MGEVPPREEALARIRTAVGPAGWIADADEMEPFLREWRGLRPGHATAIVRPANLAEVAEVVRSCAAAGIAIVPQAGNTSLCGGSVPEDGKAIVLSVARLDRVREIDPVDDTITVEAGCVLADVQRAAAAAGRLFPLSLAAEGSCRIGGNLATNAGGVHVLRYGSMRALTLGLEVVLPDGRVWDGLRKLRKDNTGYDLKQLFIGSEGTLGVITAAVLRLFPQPRGRWVALVGVADPRASVALLEHARAALGEVVTSFELVPRIALDLVLRHIPATVDPLSGSHAWYVLVDFQSTDEDDAALQARAQRWLEENASRGLVEDAAVATSAAQAEALWRLRESISEAQRHEGASIKHDVSVPVSRLAEFVAIARERVEREWPGVRVVAFGHVGDGNVHFNLSVPVGGDGKAFLAHWGAFNRIVHDVVGSFAGSVAAEHGIGRLKRDELVRVKSAVEIDLMRTVKRALDPAGIMNPGCIL